MSVVGDSNNAWQSRMRNVAICEAAARSRKAKRLVRRFEAAAKDMGFIGTMDPSLHDVIKQNYNHTRAELLAFMGV